VWSTGFSSDGKILATAGADAHVKLWNVADGSLRADLVGHTDTVTWLSFSPDGRTVASTGGDTTVKVWDSLTGQLKTTLLGHTDYNYCVAFSPDGQTLASGGLDNSIRVWRTADDEQVKADLVRRKSERKGR
jgi:WD40 repeat protein